MWRGVLTRDQSDHHVTLVLSCKVDNVGRVSGEISSGVPEMFHLLMDETCYR